MTVFASEDYDGVPQHTWVHNRDIQVVEIPTRIWELHRLSVEAWLTRADREREAKETAKPKRAGRKKTKRGN
jgi:hypothetical protein